MNEQALAAEHAKLNIEYESFITELRSEWILKNRHRGKRWDGTGDVYEVMRPEEKAEVHSIIDRWTWHITPIAEKWWNDRGWGVIWPDDNSQPMKLYHLESSTA